MILVVVKEPGRPGEIRKIEANLEAVREIVGGFVEQHGFWVHGKRQSFPVVLMCDEDGKMKEKDLCLSVPPDSYVGTLVFTRWRRDVLVGLDRKDAEKLLRVLDP